MKTGLSGLNLIKQFEGCRLESYRCPAGILSIGFGSTENVYDGMRITFDEAVRRLQAHLGPLEQEIVECVKGPLSQSQFDALVCLGYNIGGGALRGSTLVKLLNQGHADQAADAFLAWDKVHGVPCAGLTRRREAERELFLKA